MVATAVLLIDFQNEFAKPEGKLHAAVDEVMTQTKMMEKVPPFVEFARNAGALIMYSPVVNLFFGEGRVQFADEDKAMDPHAYGDQDYLFADGTWNSKIVDELEPKESDIVLTNRTDFSVFSGTALNQTLRKYGIKRLIIAGFLTDICILETVKGLVQEGFGGIDAIVLIDGCASKSIQTQFATINDDGGLSTMADCCTTDEVVEKLKVVPCSEIKPVKVTGGTTRPKARRRFTMFDQVKQLRLAMVDKWVAGDRFVRFLDRDADGNVTYDEFYDFLNQFGLIQEARIDPAQVFSILDTKNKGEIATETLLEALHFTDEDLQAVEEEGGGLADADKLPPFDSPFLVGLVAHNNMKPAMMKFVKDHLSFFSRVKLVTTGSTGRSLASLGLEVDHLVASGPLGGDQEIGGLITEGQVVAVFFFTDPLTAHPHAADIDALNRICCVHDTMFANNPSTAKALVFALENSPFGYSRLTGQNPEMNKQTAVVDAYLEGQAKVIAENKKAAEALGNQNEDAAKAVAMKAKAKLRQSVLTAPRPGDAADKPYDTRTADVQGTRKSTIFANKY